MSMDEIILFGAPINSNNMGCVALTYSILDLINHINVESNKQIRCTVFEYFSDQSKAENVNKALQLKIHLESRPLGIFHDPLRYIRHIRANIPMQRIIKASDLVIDLTEGDSFTDIYGQFLFDKQVMIKEYAIKQGKKLVLGSQTYGPFSEDKNYERAINVINRSYCTIARDSISKDYIERRTDKKIYMTSDLAFRLPYCKENVELPACSGRKVGINVSGLLVKDKTEGTDVHFLLKSNYDELIDQLVKDLLVTGKTVFLISHVAEDYLVCEKLHEKYPETILVPKFNTPIEAKSYIANMDLFIGSRMHATIAAMTSGVPCIPLAYSRKFKGVFETVEYPYVIDLQEENTESAFEKTKYLIENYDELKKCEEHAYERAQEEIKKTYEIYKKVILKALSK